MVSLLSTAAAVIGAALLCVGFEAARAQGGFQPSTPTTVSLRLHTGVLKQTSLKVKPEAKAKAVQSEKVVRDANLIPTTESQIGALSNPGEPSFALFEVNSPLIDASDSRSGVNGRPAIGVYKMHGEADANLIFSTESQAGHVTSPGSSNSTFGIRVRTISKPVKISNSAKAPIKAKHHSTSADSNLMFTTESQIGTLTVPGE